MKLLEQKQRIKKLIKVAEKIYPGSDVLKEYEKALNEENSEVINMIHMNLVKAISIHVQKLKTELKEIEAEMEMDKSKIITL